MKRYFALLLSVLLLLSALTGCGAKSESAAMAADTKFEEAFEEEVAMETPMEEPAEIEEISTTVQDTADTVLPEELQENAEKIVYSGYVCMETTQFDEAIASLERAVKSAGGFVQDSNVHGSTVIDSNGNTAVVDRWGYYVVRIPSDGFDAFLLMTGGIGNVTSSSRTAENVTSQYTDYEARLASLNTQEERLLAMLEESGDLESLIQLEARLSEVRYEIESIERNLRNLQQRLSYSTVTLEIQEVELYTPTAAVKRTFGEKLSDAFADGWSGFVRSVQRFVLGVVRSLPGLVLLALAVVAVLLVLRRIRRSRRAKKAKVGEDRQEET